MLKGKKVLLAVCGSIAAYKTAFFVRLLVKEGVQVKVIMTESAKDFITPLTLATLSKNPVESGFFDKESGTWTSHVELGLWADVMVIAPSTANTIAKLANGICDNLLTATYLSARCPIMVAPAMDLDMYQHPTTRKNLAVLSENGNALVQPGHGELASGLVGEGRMAEPEELLEALDKHFDRFNELEGTKVLITSGPTQEPIDPVRYIGNRSSGKMGRALAMACAHRGASVLFISGPVEHLPEHSNVEIVRVNTALEMYDEVRKHIKNCTVNIFTAAVADYRPEERTDNKIKRSGLSLDIKLVENPDIAAEMGKLKPKDHIHVGFALETSKDPENALSKLERKNFDLIVLNSLADEKAGFGHNTNKVTIYGKNNKSQSFELKSKNEVAIDIVDSIVNLMHEK
jgi:phosphopantothenoylcysteine decarboxylase/phosphopantothenate--cysteine ligase